MSPTLSLYQRGGEQAFALATCVMRFGLLMGTATSESPLARDFGWGQPRKGGGIHPFWAPPESLAVPVTRRQTGTWQMPEAEGLETLLGNTHPGSSFLEFLKAHVEGPTPSGRAQENLSTRPGGGNAAWEWRGGSATFQPRLPPGPQPRGAPGSASENKALRFQPKVKVHREHFLPPESKSDCVSPNKPPINQHWGRLLRSSADLGEWISC